MKMVSNHNFNFCMMTLPYVFFITCYDFSRKPRHHHSTRERESVSTAVQHLRQQETRNDIDGETIYLTNTSVQGRGDAMEIGQVSAKHGVNRLLKIHVLIFHSKSSPKL